MTKCILAAIAVLFLACGVCEAGCRATVRVAAVRAKRQQVILVQRQFVPVATLVQPSFSVTAIPVAQPVQFVVVPAPVIQK